MILFHSDQYILNDVKKNNSNTFLGIDSVNVTITLHIVYVITIITIT